MEAGVEGKGRREEQNWKWKWPRRSAVLYAVRGTAVRACVCLRLTSTIQYTQYRITLGPGGSIKSLILFSIYYHYSIVYTTDPLEYFIKYTST
jgi:hypothetical protein